MAFIEALARAVDGPSDNLEATVQTLYNSKQAEQHKQRPDSSIVYNRSFNHTLKKVSGALTAARKHYEAWREEQSSEAAKQRGAQNFADVTRAILDYEPRGRPEPIGDSLEQGLKDWMQERSVQLDRAHQDAIRFHSAKSEVENRVVYRFEDLDEGKQHAKSVPVSDVKKRSAKPQTRAEEQRRQLMQFPTEGQARQYLEMNFHQLLREPGVVEELDFVNKYNDGHLRVTPENTTILGSGTQPAKIISRTKQGKIGKIDSESYKLFKSITGLRAEKGKKPYSYDSIAMWHTNLDPEDVISTALHYYHDANTSNGGRPDEAITDADTFYETAPAGQSGYNVTAQNDTPGAPYEFHRLLHTKARRASLSQRIQQLTALQPSGYLDSQKQAYMQNWLDGLKPRSEEERTYQELLNETRAELASTYKRFLNNVIKPRDKALAEKGSESGLTFGDLITGYKGSLIRRQTPVKQRKRQEINVPFELRLNDNEDTDREGAGSISGAKGEGEGIGKHVEYKRHRTEAANLLREKGLFKPYKVIRERLPILSY